MQAALNVHVECDWIALHKSGCMHFARNDMRFIEYHTIDLGRLGFIYDWNWLLSWDWQFFCIYVIGSNGCSSLRLGLKLLSLLSGIDKEVSEKFYLHFVIQYKRLNLRRNCRSTSESWVYDDYSSNIFFLLCLSNHVLSIIRFIEPEYDVTLS